jgi:ribosomal protein S12 methylthiotransferase
MSPAPAPPSVYIHTLGCPKNDADSRSLSRTLNSAGVRIAEDPAMATYILINTCGFIKDAKEESIGAILDACGNYGGGRVVVTGCLVERYLADLRVGIPEVAGWFGLSDTEGLLACLRGDAAELPGAGVGPIQVGSYAYVKISDGCDELCSFCAIPAIKGKYYSVDPADILAEAGSCLAEGARELVLVGQDTAVWSHGALGLTGLVDLLAADERVRRIRLLYLQPEHVTDELLRYMAAQPKLCRYLDIPFQHADPVVLGRMGRWGGGNDYLELLARARRLMPDVSVRSTFIVGFPGETDEQFETLLDFAGDAGFDHAGGFIYSPEEGTSAAGLKPAVRRSVARERLNRLTSLLGAQAERQNRQLIDGRVAVMLDSRDPEELDEGMAAVGRTAGQAPEVDGVTHIEGDLPDHYGPGDIVTVKVTDAMGYDLVGAYDEA